MWYTPESDGAGSSLDGRKPTYEEWMRMHNPRPGSGLTMMPGQRPRMPSEYFDPLPLEQLLMLLEARRSQRAGPQSMK